jgi:protocatechuate 3,4-dioxygenase beta subunit
MRLVPLLVAVWTVTMAVAPGGAAQSQTQAPSRPGPTTPQTPGPRPAAPAAGPVRDPGGRGSSLPAGTSVLTGTVTTSGGQPAAGARVMVGGEGPSRISMTDARGRFSVTGLRAGRYFVTVSKQGYVSVTYGQRRANSQGMPVPLGDGDTREIAMQLPRGGVITGMVLDERGEPAVNASVRAMRYAMVGGERRPQQTGGDSTDDRGIYRIHSLQPGDYAVCATVRNNGPQNDAQRVQSEMEMLRRSMLNAPTPAARQQLQVRLSDLQAQLPAQGEPVSGYAPVCFPGASPSASTTIPVAAGEEKANVDLQLLLTTVARVEGTLVAPAGVELRNVQVGLSNVDDALTSIDRQFAGADPTGRFVFENVPPGRYTLVARSLPGGGPMAPPPPPAGGAPAAAPPRFWASADLTVAGEDITGIMLEMQRGATITGQLVLQGTTAQAPGDLSRAQISVFPFSPEMNAMLMGGSNAQAVVDAGGKFTISDVFPGKYRVSAGLPGSAGWFVESVTANGEDALDMPLEVLNRRTISGVVITMGDRITELSGTVVDDKGRPATEQTLLLYPVDQKYWLPQSRRIRTTRAGEDGQYTFRLVPPGDYRLTTLVDPEPGSWYDKALLTELDASSVRISLAAGEKRVEHVRIR